MWVSFDTIRCAALYVNRSVRLEINVRGFFNPEANL